MSKTIVFISAEVDPFAKQGGLADVSRSLPKALQRLGNRVIVVTPLYGSTDIKKHQLEQITKGFPVRMSEKTVIKTDFWRGYLAEDLPVYFIDYPKFFSSRKNKKIYNLRDMADNGERYYFFCSAVLHLLRLKNIKPDVVHANDWQTGLVPYFLKKRFKEEELFKNVGCVFSVHNLLFQGPKNWWEVEKSKQDTGHTGLPSFDNKAELPYINFMKRGILRSDVINTVSEQYAKEILTPEFGLQVYRILNNKNKEGKFFGITNGIDYTDYNPKTDPGLFANYTAESFHKQKPKNKKAIQKRYGLPISPQTPLIVTNSRVTEQKGFDIFLKVAETILERDVQFIIFGDTAEKKYGTNFRQLQKKHPQKFVFTKFVSKEETHLLAGADMLLMPSRFEPCGLGQLKSMRYGALPIVRATGGLVDTVEDYDPTTKRGTGFVFSKYNEKSLLIALIRAMETFQYSEIWNGLIFQAMNKSFDWEIPASRYMTLYEKALEERKNEQ